MPSAAAGSGPPDARVLLIRMSALGDLVFALPAVQALRHLMPQAHVEWLVEDRHAELPAGHPAVDETVVFPRRQWRAHRGLGRLRALGGLADHFLALRERGPYDLVLDLQGNLKSGLHLLFLKAARTIGFDRPVAREGAWRFVRERVDPGSVHRCERDLALVRALGYRGPLPAPAPWPLPPETVRDVEMRLDHSCARPEQAREAGPLILFHTEVTRYGREKRWPEARWRELARRAAASHGARVLVLWTPATRSRVLALCEGSDGACGLAPPTPSLAHLMALTDRAAVVVGTDSGPLHLAAFRGSPVVALFGPTDPRTYRPHGPRVECVSALEEGEAPPERDRSGPSPLMERLAVEKVESALEACLRGSGAPAA